VVGATRCPSMQQLCGEGGWVGALSRATSQWERASERGGLHAGATAWPCGRHLQPRSHAPRSHGPQPISQWSRPCALSEGRCAGRPALARLRKRKPRTPRARQRCSSTGSWESSHIQHPAVCTPCAQHPPAVCGHPLQDRHGA